MTEKLSRGPIGPTVDLIRVDPENDEELAAWLESMDPNQRTKMLLSSVRGFSQGGPRNKHSNAQVGRNRAIRHSDESRFPGNLTCRSTPSMIRPGTQETAYDKRRPATEGSRLRLKPLYDVETERQKLAALQVRRLHECHERRDR